MDYRLQVTYETRGIVFRGEATVVGSSASATQAEAAVREAELRKALAKPPAEGGPVVLWIDGAIFERIFKQPRETS